MDPTVSLPLLRVSVASITSLHGCTNRNQFDILMTTVTNVIKGQPDMSYNGERQTLIPDEHAYAHFWQVPPFHQQVIHIKILPRPTLPLFNKMSQNLFIWQVIFLPVQHTLTLLTDAKYCYVHHKFCLSLLSYFSLILLLPWQPNSNTPTFLHL